MKRGGRFFIGAATTTYAPETDLEDRPELAQVLVEAQSLFTTLGYEPVAGFGLGLEAEDFLKRLRAFLRSADRGEDDVVVVYYTGHGLTFDDDLLLPMADATDDLTFTSLRASRLTGQVLADEPRGIRVQRLMFILDTCHAAAAREALASGAASFMNRLGGLSRQPSIAIVVSSRPYEEVEAGVFVTALAKAIEHPSTGGPLQEHLYLDQVISVVNQTTPHNQHVGLVSIGEFAGAFFVNPKFESWLRDADRRSAERQEQRRAREAEILRHVLPRASGVDSADGRTDRQLFIGRHRALADICQWMRRPQPATLIVTASPGSGKSSLLSRLYVLADRRLRARIPGLHLLPADTVPELSSIDRFILARGLSPRRLLAALAEACDVDIPESVGALLANLHEQNSPRTLIIDAVDEAEDEAGRRDPSAVVDHVLAPLVNAAGRVGLRLLIGTRANLVEDIGSPSRIIDLDNADYTNRASVRAYARSCLIDLIAESSYRHLEPAYVDAVADAIGTAAGDSFLVALITARSLALTPRLVDPYDQAWRRGLPRLAADAMRQDLELRLQEDASRARALLLPLAYAQGTGLPWEDMWPALAGRLSGEAYANDDIDWLFSHAGFYVTEYLTGVRSTYGLYHEALAQHLQEGRDTEADHAMIVEALTAMTPRLVDGSTDWRRAHPYVSASLAFHAAAGRKLDQLLLEPRFLLGMPRASLLSAISAAENPQARAAADAYRRVSTRLEFRQKSQQAAYLQLAARCCDANELAGAISVSGLPLPFTTAWASWRLQPPHDRMPGSRGWVASVALGELDGTAIIAAGDGEGEHAVRVWDAATASPLRPPLLGHSDTVSSVDIGVVDGRTAIASASSDKTLRLWDLGTGAQLVPLMEHDAGVTSVAFGQLRSRTIIAAGSSDATVRLWSAETGAAIAEPIREHSDRITSVAITTFGSRTILASGAQDGMVIIWDVGAATLAVPPIQVRRKVTCVALGTVNGSLTVAAACSDRMLRMWNALTGEPVSEPVAADRQWINSLRFGRFDGKAVVITGGVDRTVRMLDALTGATIREFAGHEELVTGVAVGQVDGRTVIASCGHDSSVRLWDASAAPPTPDRIFEHRAPVTAVATVDLDGRDVIVSAGEDGFVARWEASSGDPVGPPFVHQDGSVAALAVGKLAGRAIIAAGGRGETVRVWDAATGDALAAFEEHAGWVTALSVGELDERTAVASCDEEGVIHLWDPRTGLRLAPSLRAVGKPVSVAIGRLPTHSVVVAVIGGFVKVWNAVTAEPMTALEAHAGGATAAVFGQLGSRAVIAAGGSDGSLQIWDAATGRRLVTKTLVHNGPVRALLVIEAGGKPVVVSGGDDALVRLWYDPLRASKAALRSRVTDLIELPSAVLGLAHTEPQLVVAATQLGVIALGLQT
ncbi:hypothetical protein Cci01nite_17060 [Catellatospora citrea]|uniref:WD40 repeat protein n=2 Tax=Catellatospora citrea TaxID=53366 RepID=A0A8J3NXR9_9ACTN|nr:WD-40 repeat-containing protein [Catellatospora citrea]GIF96612.1 hypothetical protein Cci01nite_17060 [Catellatospora citrea]